MAKGQTSRHLRLIRKFQTVVSLNDEIVSLKDAGQKQARSQLFAREDYAVMSWVLAPTLGDANSLDNKVNNQIPDKATASRTKRLVT
jgi:hypothetical protein